MIIIATESKVCESNMNIGKDSMVKLDIDVWIQKKGDMFDEEEMH
jgi:hypothetical protein